MDGIFGVGPLEILLVLVLALIFLGPQDMVKTARQLGRTLYRLYHSPVWRQIMSTQQELRDLPTKFVREAGLENTLADLKKSQAEIQADLRQVTSAAKAELTAASQEIKSPKAPAPIPPAPSAAGLTTTPQDINILPPVPPTAPSLPAPLPPDEPDNFSI